MINKLISFIIGIVLALSSQNILALCIAQEGDPYELAHSVYLAEIVAPDPVEKSNFTSSAQIKVIKIYKSDNMELTKQFHKLTSSSRYGRPEGFITGDQYLLYDQPSIHRCNYINRKIVSPDALRLFEKQHQPIWVYSGD